LSVTPDENNELLLTLAVAQGLLTQEQADEATSVMDKMAELGVPEELSQILIKKGFVEESQIKELAQRVVPRQPVRIGGFEILTRIGKGAMGAVYRARQVSMDRIVALKVLPPRLARDSNFVERFFREAQAVASLNHPNIVSGIDVGEADGYHYFAMEFVEGITVQDLIKQDGCVPEKRSLEISRQIAQALHHAHSHNMVHRDVKPENIMVTAGGVAKLCDLGLAKSLASDSSMTQTGITVGTPHYISPEQARGDDDIDIRADIYSLGATLFHMLAGKTVYSGSSAAIVMTMHISEPIPDLRQECSDVSIGVSRLVGKMLAKKAADRYESPEALIADIDRVARGGMPKGAAAAAIPHRVRHAQRRHGTTNQADPITGRRSSGSKKTGMLVGVGLALLLGCVAIYFAVSGNGGSGNSNKGSGGSGSETNGGKLNGSGTVNGGKVSNGSGNSREDFRRKRNASLRANLAKIDVYWKRNPTDFGRTLFLLRKLEYKSDKTPVASEVAAKTLEVEAARKHNHTMAYQETRRKSELLVAKKQYGKAIELYDKLPLSMLPKTVKDIKRINGLARSQFEEHKARAWKLLEPKVYQSKKQGNLSAALKTFAPVSGYGIKKLSEEARSESAKLLKEHKLRLDNLAKSIRDQKARAIAKARNEYLACRMALFANAAKINRKKVFSFSEALASIPETMRVEEFEPFTGQTNRMENDLKSLAKFLDDLPVKVSGRKGIKCSLRFGSGIQQGIIVTANIHSVAIKPPGMRGSISFEYHRIDSGDVVNLAGGDPATPAGAYIAGLWSFYSGRQEAAVPFMKTASADSSLKSGAEYYLGLLQASIQARLESEATELLRECRSTFKSLSDSKVPQGDKRWRELAAKIKLLKNKYGSTKAVKKN
jgi:eukaryotic-like serine/threonine-protein kinase